MSTKREMQDEIDSLKEQLRRNKRLLKQASLNLEDMTVSQLSLEAVQERIKQQRDQKRISNPNSSIACLPL